MVKLYNIILEGNYDSAVTLLSRGLVKAIKSKKKKYIEEIISDNLDFELRTKIIYNNNIDYAFDLSAETHFDIVYMEVIVNPNMLDKYFNDFIADLKGTLRHEIEHVTQFEKEPKFIKMDKHASEMEGTEYLLAKNEIPAFVHDVYKQAKTRKTTWTKQAMHYLLRMQEPYNLSDKDLKKVLNVWKAYAKKYLPRARF